MRLYNYLKESTFELGKDVDRLYKTLKIDRAIKLMKTDISKFLDECIHLDPDRLIVYSMTDSRILRTEDGKRGHDIQPISIQFGVYETNYYNPLKDTIFITIHPEIYQLFYHLGTEEKIKEELPNAAFIRVKNELSSTAIKSSIYHELSHWIHDVTTGVNLANIESILDYREMNAQMHNIKQIKRDYEGQWNKLTLIDLLEIVPSLFSVFLEATHEKSEKEYRAFMKKFIKRMHRESLLGKNMKMLSRQKMVKELNRLNFQ